MGQYLDCCRPGVLIDSDEEASIASIPLRDRKIKIVTNVNPNIPLDCIGEIISYFHTPKDFFNSVLTCKWVFRYVLKENPSCGSNVNFRLLNIDRLNLKDDLSQSKKPYVYKLRLTKEHQVKMRDFKLLQLFPQLTDLTIDTQIHLQEVSLGLNVFYPKRLRTLQVYNNYKISKKSLLVFTNLTSIVFRNCSKIDDSICLCKFSKTLTKLEISHCPFFSGKNLRKLVKLEELKFSENPNEHYNKNSLKKNYLLSKYFYKSPSPSPSSSSQVRKISMNDKNNNDEEEEEGEEEEDDFEEEEYQSSFNGEEENEEEEEKNNGTYINKKTVVLLSSETSGFKREKVAVLPYLKTLELRCCDSVTPIIFSFLPSLEKLVIHRCQNLNDTIFTKYLSNSTSIIPSTSTTTTTTNTVIRSSFSKIKELILEGNESITCRGVWNLKNLESLTIRQSFHFSDDTLSTILSNALQQCSSSSSSSPSKKKLLSSSSISKEEEEKQVIIKKEHRKLQKIVICDCWNLVGYGFKPLLLLKEEEEEEEEESEEEEEEYVLKELILDCCGVKDSIFQFLKNIQKLEIKYCNSITAKKIIYFYEQQQKNVKQQKLKKKIEKQQQQQQQQQQQEEEEEEEDDDEKLKKEEDEEVYITDGRNKLDLILEQFEREENLESISMDNEEDEYDDEVLMEREVDILFPSSSSSLDNNNKKKNKKKKKKKKNDDDDIISPSLSPLREGGIQREGQKKKNKKRSHSATSSPISIFFNRKKKKKKKNKKKKPTKKKKKQRTTTKNKQKRSKSLEPKKASYHTIINEESEESEESESESESESSDDDDNNNKRKKKKKKNKSSQKRMVMINDIEKRKMVGLKVTNLVLEFCDHITDEIFLHTPDLETLRITHCKNMDGRYFCDPSSSSSSYSSSKRRRQILNNNNNNKQKKKKKNVKKKKKRKKLNLLGGIIGDISTVGESSNDAGLASQYIQNEIFNLRNSPITSTISNNNRMLILNEENDDDDDDEEEELRRFEKLADDLEEEEEESSNNNNDENSEDNPLKEEEEEEDSSVEEEEDDENIYFPKLRSIVFCGCSKKNNKFLNIQHLKKFGEFQKKKFGIQEFIVEERLLDEFEFKEIELTNSLSMIKKVSESL